MSMNGGAASAAIVSRRLPTAQPKAVWLLDDLGAVLRSRSTSPHGLHVFCIAPPYIRLMPLDEVGGKSSPYRRVKHRQASNNTTALYEGA